MKKKPSKAKGGRSQTAKRLGDCLLIEILTEELPPKSLQRLSQAFAENVFEGLRQQSFLTDASTLQAFATPRRLAVIVSAVSGRQPDRAVERRGPPVSASYDAAGKPTAALAGFAKSCGVDPAKLEKRAGDKSEYFVYSSKQKGELLVRHLAAVVEAALKKLPVAKMMRWGSKDIEFVRPVHGLIMMHGTRVVAGEVLGLKSTNKTLGHRFLSRGKIAVPRADFYAETLHRSGHVVASFEQRRAEIDRELRAAAQGISKSCRVLPDEGGRAGSSITKWQLAAREVIQNNAVLLDEVTALVEWPAIYAGRFDSEFLNIPISCLALSMQLHQKYFPLVHRQANGSLLPDFLVVSNIDTRTPGNIIHGNERVLRARLSDAKFFFEQDRKTRLEERVPRLANVVYQNKLGSQLERVHRIQKLAGGIADRLGMVSADKLDAERAAYLCKADLLTEMVGEFPELQGMMGSFYAEVDGERPQVVQAIRAHYAPRFAGDGLPSDKAEICVGLADKIDTLVGIYGVGLVPTGDKDPFGLRRQALGVVRILIERSLPLDLRDLLTLARGYFADDVLSGSVVQDLYGFALDRLRPYLRDRGFLPDEIDAVLSLEPGRLDQALLRLEALQVFRRLPEADALAGANKRIRNILRQSGQGLSGQLNPTLFTDEAELRLGQQLESLRPRVQVLIESGDFTAALRQLAGLHAAIDEFFARVMVMAEDLAVRNNRLALLNDLSSLFLGVADISKLQGRQ